ncbi:zf-HC2 domain-containing protein [Psychrobacillus sp. FSL K6-2684]|uniref:Zf-HC2 domain-containing protein n=1 Tax=Psychrobacillus faecigallinarum TaxID=2762235 RepID=A0ABR8RDH9_9BACI|nr:zf-HC2 domain-containing protein [Psychrobacillus faecigallinarum]MBD7945790.1 zf-HC2 domain-containing protein [Psychrobacillus faecigallinarum]
MKNECYIVRDLLPTYIDKLCSLESAEFVDQHIATCDKCTQIAKQMRAEFDIDENVDITANMEQKKPLKKLANFFNAQRGYTAFLRAAFWISLIVTVGFFIYSLSVLNDINDERKVARSVEQEKQEVMEQSFEVLSTNLDETALQKIFQEYSDHLQHLAVFSTDHINDFTLIREGITHPYSIDFSRLKEGPSNAYPINYSQAELVVGDGGTVTELIIPNDYDIGTVAMANEEWIIQFEYKEAYFDTVERAHQSKYYGPSNWIIFQLPLILLVITSFILGNWIFQKRITKPVNNMLD